MISILGKAGCARVGVHVRKGCHCSLGTSVGSESQRQLQKLSTKFLVSHAHLLVSFFFYFLYNFNFRLRAYVEYHFCHSLAQGGYEMAMLTGNSDSISRLRRDFCANHLSLHIRISTRIQGGYHSLLTPTHRQPPFKNVTI